jgi:hypothetical protein
MNALIAQHVMLEKYISLKKLMLLNFGDQLSAEKKENIKKEIKECEEKFEKNEEKEIVT